MEKQRLRCHIVSAGAIIGIYLYFFALFSWLGMHNFMYLEHLCTFYYDGDAIIGALGIPGGLSRLLGDFLIQFFVVPYAGVAITAALLTVMTLLTARLLRIIYGDSRLAPLGLLAPTVTTVLHYNINYMYGGTIAMILMLVALMGMFRSDGRYRFGGLRHQLLYAITVTVLLYVSCGSIALLYSVTMLVIAAFKSPRQGVYYLLLPPIVLALGYISVRVGHMPDLRHALLPEQYFTHRLRAAQYVYMPWYTLAGVILLACLMSLRRAHSSWSRGVVRGVSLIAVVATACALSFNVNADNETFKRLNCHVRDGRWHDIIRYASAHPLNNMLSLNCLNLALAQEGMLADSLFRQPCIDIRNIYNNNQSTPYMYMLLSDIYYSMGHISLSRRHAFEANEALDNASPRMLQRLVDVNIIYGDYDVARKYLSALDRTLYYRQWAAARRALIDRGGIDADSVLAAKRACIFADNRFAGIGGLDDDLRRIVRCNPEHTPTIQYLGCLYLLSHDVTRFMDVVNEFNGSAALPQPMPTAFQEGVLAAVDDSDSICAEYGIDAATRQRYREFSQSPQSHRECLWYFLRYVN